MSEAIETLRRSREGPAPSGAARACRRPTARGPGAAIVAACQVRGRLGRVLEILDAKGQRERDHQTGDDRGEPIAPRVGRERSAWHLGAIDDLHVVRAAVADDAELFLLLQQRLIDLTVRLRLTLQHEVRAALAIEIHRGALL